MSQCRQARPTLGAWLVCSIWQLVQSDGLVNGALGTVSSIISTGSQVTTRPDSGGYEGRKVWSWSSVCGIQQSQVIELTVYQDKTSSKVDSGMERLTSNPLPQAPLQTASADSCINIPCQAVNTCDVLYRNIPQATTQSTTSLSTTNQ